jgi:hypothetical protein
MAYAPGPPVLKTADFSGIAPDDFIIPVTEKRRVKVDKVDGVRLYGLEDFEVVTED